MSNIDAIIAQVVTEYSDFRSKIDEDILYREAVLATKELGNLSTDFYEDVIHIEKGKGILPSNFYRMDLALLCDYHDVCETTPLEVRRLIQTDYVVELDFFKTKWVDCNTCCKESSYSSLDRHIFLKRTIGGVKYYDKFNPVTIAKHSIKSSCTPNCENKYFNCKKELTINYRQGTIHTNFNEGSLYVKYKGFPQDDDGNIDFNDTHNGNFERYVEYVLKVKVAEMLMGVAGASHIANLFQYFIQNRDRYRLKASQEKICENYDAKDFQRKVEIQNRKDYNKLSRYRR